MEVREGGSVAACSLGSRLGPSAGPETPWSYSSIACSDPLGVRKPPWAGPALNSDMCL